jgi:hypothetical protein
MIDWYSRLATRKLPPLPHGLFYRWSSGEWIEDSVPSTVKIVVNIVELDMFGNICNWDAGKTSTLFVTKEQLEEEFLLWEKENDKCYQCEGTGQERIGWNHITGDKFRPCKRCDSTGKPLLS